MFRKIVFLKSGKNLWKFVLRSSFLITLRLPACNFTTEWTPLHVIFKGFTYILMTFLVFSIIFWNTDLQKISYCNRKQNCSIKAGFRQSAINHQKILKMFEAKMLENFLWKSSAIVKLQFYTNSSQKHLF